MNRSLYPNIEPYNTFYYNVTSPHQLYVEECGNPLGVPVIFIHGGPGAGCSREDRRFFNPDIFRVVLFDQRGCNRSKPLGLLENNTTNDLINDIELIRAHLKIDKWFVFGGSWGSTLSLLYAENFPERVLHLILRGIFLGSDNEFQHLNSGAASHFYPEEFLVYKSIIPEENHNDLHLAYYEILKNSNVDKKLEAARLFMNWDMLNVSLESTFIPISKEEVTEKLLAEALIQCHYMVNKCFLGKGQVINNIRNIINLPVTIVHGRYDLLCAPKIAFELHKLLPQSEMFFIQTAGHSSRDKGTLDRLVGIMDELGMSLK